MNLTSTIGKDLCMPEWMQNQYPQYLRITENDQDLELFRSCHDVFATSQIAKQSVGTDKISHSLNLAKAVATVFHIYMNSDLDLIDYLEGLQGMDEKKAFLLQFLKIQTSSLEKTEIDLYLNLLFNNNSVDRQKIDDKFEFGFLYTFTFLTEVAEFWGKNKIYQSFEWNILNSEDLQPKQPTPIAIYQMTPSYPPIVLLNCTQQELCQKILEQHQQYILNLIIEMLLNTRQDYIDQHLQFQSYKYKTLEQFIEMLIKQCTTLSTNRKNDLMNNPIIISYYERNLKSTKSIEEIQSELKSQITKIEQQQQQQQQQQQKGQQQNNQDVFKTQAFDQNNNPQQKAGPRFKTQVV